MKFKLKNSAWTTLVILTPIFCFAQGMHGVSSENPFGKVHPDAPDQLLDYKELIGTCDCISMQRNAQGTFSDTVQSTWTFKYILDGKAIQDETYKSDGRHTSSIRQFNTDSMQWYVTFFNSAVAAPSPPSWSGSSRNRGDKMVLKMPQKAPNGMEGFSKLTFYDISSAGFKWVGEWIMPDESVVYPFWKIECTKRKDLSVLSGKWKVEGKETYEIWEIEAHGDMSGYAYKIKNGEKKVTETLAIQKVNGTIVYSALVKNQNDGKSIPFTLNISVTDKLSFENPNHDFPQKIQYTPLSNDRMHVNVLGANDRGFSYELIRQK